MAALESPRANALCQRLMALECPYLRGVEDLGVVREVLFTPGDARLRIIQWLVGCFHPQLGEILYAPGHSAACPVPKLVGLLTDMGLAKREDYELIRGVSSHARQLVFLEALFDLLDVGREESSLEEEKSGSMELLAERCVYFNDALCRREELGQVFPSSASLLPPEVHLPPITRHPPSHRTEAKRPSLSLLLQEARHLKQALERRLEELEVLSHQVYLDLNRPALEKHCKSVSVLLSTLSQTLVSLQHTYQCELRPWIHREGLLQTGTGLGPLCKRVHSHSQNLSKLLKSLEKIQNSLAGLESMGSPASKADLASLSCVCRQALEAFGEFESLMGQTTAAIHKRQLPSITGSSGQLMASH